MRKVVLLFIICFFVSLGCSTNKGARLKIGDNAPDFVVEDLSGQSIRLSSLKGRPVVVRFFITDCKFCKADTPIFNRYFEKYREQGLMVLYLTKTTEQARVRKFTDDLKIPFPVAIDYGQKVSKLYNVNVEPQTIILDSDHLIKGAILGGVTEVELDEILAEEWRNT